MVLLQVQGFLVTVLPLGLLASVVGRAHVAPSNV